MRRATMTDTREIVERLGEIRQLVDEDHPKSCSGLIDRIDSIIASLTLTEDTGWQDISTAPHGEEVLLSQSAVHARPRQSARGRLCVLR